MFHILIAACLDMNCMELQALLRKFSSERRSTWLESLAHWSIHMNVLPTVAVNGNRIVASNRIAKEVYGIDRNLKLEDAKRIVGQKLRIINIPSLQDGRPSRAHIDWAKQQVYRAIVELIDELGLDIGGIEKGHGDEMFLDLSPEINRRLEEDPQPWIYPENLKENLFLEYATRQIDYAYLTDFNTTKLYLSQNYPAYYYAGEVMTLLMDGIFKKTGFQFSGGVGKDRFNAKLATIINPYDASLTLFTPDAFQRVAENMEIEKVVGFKGAWGQRIRREFQIDYLSELQNVSTRDLARFLGNWDMAREFRGKSFGTLSQNFQDNAPIKWEI